ncbi:MAG TPA: succinate dehydrogenase cytochrome b subunit [Vicinamibacterales bacterium]|nr:succinate dehydrogenase cytochrome b subunit [Vicinamibacterales bacterium]
MSSFRSVFSSSVGTKLLIGATGLLLFAYLLLHLAGNLLVFVGQDTFNHYSHMLISNPLTVPVEIALALVFVLHVYKTVVMWLGNRRARLVGYEKKTWAGHTSRKSLSSTTMIWTGLVTLVFVGIHLAQMKYGAWYEIGNPAIRDLYRTELEVFASPIWVAVYVACMILIGFHLRHGISSAFQSIGANHPVYTKRLVVIGTILAIIIGGGFAVIPIWVYLTQ